MSDMNNQFDFDDDNGDIYDDECYGIIIIFIDDDGDDCDDVGGDDHDDDYGDGDDGEYGVMVLVMDDEDN